MADSSSGIETEGKKKRSKKFDPDMAANDMHYKPYLDRIKKSMFSGVILMTETVMECVEKTMEMYNCYLNGEYKEAEAMHQCIQDLEFTADNIKNTIRDKMPRRLFSDMDPEAVNALVHQLDGIADSCEDVADLLIVRQVEYPEAVKGLIREHNRAVYRTTKKLNEVINRAEQIFRRAFRKKDVDELQEKLYRVATLKWQADKVKKRLRQALYNPDHNLDPVVVLLSSRLLYFMDKIADRAENVEEILRSMVAK